MTNRPRTTAPTESSAKKSAAVCQDRPKTASSNPVTMAANPSQRKNEPGAISSTPIRTTPRMIQAQAPRLMKAFWIMDAHFLPSP
jgi:hypothetical protein